MRDDGRATVRLRFTAAGGRALAEVAEARLAISGAGATAEVTLTR